MLVLPPLLYLIDLDDTMLFSRHNWTIESLIEDNLRNLDLLTEIAREKKDGYFYVPGVVFTGRDKIQVHAIRKLFLKKGFVFISIICRQWDIPVPFNEKRFYMRYWTDKMLYAIQWSENHPKVKIEFWEDDPVLCAMARFYKFNCRQFHECKLVSTEVF